MDADDRLRTRKALLRLRDVLKSARVLTNHEVRRIAGSRGMGRVHELIHEFGEPITVKKVDGSTWNVIYGAAPPEPRPADRLF